MVMQTHPLKQPTLFLTAILLSLAPLACTRQPKPQNASPAARLHTVTHGAVTHSIIIGGAIRPSDYALVACQVGTGWIPYDTRDAAFENAQARLTYMIPEGSFVKPGDILFQMETTYLQDILYQIESDYNVAHASFITYREALIIAQLQGESETLIAQTNLDFAKLDLDKYLNGEYPMLRHTLTADVTNTKGHAQNAQAELNQSIKLHNNGYIADTDLDADRLLNKEKQGAYKIAKDELILFDQFQHPRAELELQKAIEQMGLNLQQAKLVALNEIEQNLNLKNAADLTQKEYKIRLDEMRAQIENCTVRAPVAGQVTLATSNGAGRDLDWPPLIAGTRIYFDEHIIHLITSPRVHMDVMLLEGDINRVNVGQPVRITSQLQPDKSFRGHIATIAPMPKQESIYRNPDLRRYKARIALDSQDHHLQQGSNALAEIILDSVQDVPTTPTQAITSLYDPATQQTQHTVQLQTPSGPIQQTVTLGLRNSMVAQITSGLKPGDIILLNPPTNQVADQNHAANLKKNWIKQNLQNTQRSSQ